MTLLKRQTHSSISVNIYPINQYAFSHTCLPSMFLLFQKRMVMGFFCSILCVFLCSFSTFVDSRSLPETSRTTVLDVTAALSKTNNVVSTMSTFHLLHDQAQSLSHSSSSLSFKLHPRVSVYRSSHADYKSLTLARLARDSDRVKSILTRLDLAINGITLSDLKPVDRNSDGSEFGVEDLQSPVISGASQGSGEYFSRVGIGNPPSSVYMVLDTGSDVNWVQCAPCGNCYQQVDPIFDPASSTSFKPFTCDASQCKSLDVSECRNDTCLYEVSYGDGSYTEGDFVTETLTLGSASVKDIAIGCGHSNEGLFVGAAGLLGLGGGSLSLTSQLNATSFSYCLVDRDTDAASTLEFDSPLPANAVTAPLLRNSQLDTFRYLGLVGFKVSGEPLPIPQSAFDVGDSGTGGVIVDSGTAVTRLPTDVYNSLRDAFVRGTQHLPSTGGMALFDTCYDLSSTPTVEVPTLSFSFPEGKELVLPAANYLVPVDSNGTFCFAFAPTTSPLSIIGNVQQQGTRVSFDLVHSRIGFAPSSC